jgi:hypothetical protein
MGPGLDTIFPTFLQCSQEENTGPYFALVKLQHFRKKDVKNT